MTVYADIIISVLVALFVRDYLYFVARRLWHVREYAVVVSRCGAALCSGCATETRRVVHFSWAHILWGGCSQRGFHGR